MLTVCVVARNEEAVLDECLASVKGVAEVLLVLDHGSVDSTTARATAAGARVLTTSAEFSEQARNHLLDEVRTPWVLFLDADERLSRPGRGRILEAVLGAPPNVLGLALERFDYLGHGRFASTRLVRLFRSDPRIRSSATRSHATVVPSIEALGGHVAQARVSVHHLDALLERDHHAKRVRRRALIERDLADGGQPYLRCFLALEHFVLGDDAKGLEALARAVAENPRCEPLARLTRAQHHRARGRLADTEVEVRAVLASWPDFRGRGSALLLLADLLRCRGRRDEASAAANQALLESNGGAGARLMLAVLAHGPARATHLAHALEENDWLLDERIYADGTALSPMRQQDVVPSGVDLRELLAERAMEPSATREPAVLST